MAVSEQNLQQKIRLAVGSMPGVVCLRNSICAGKTVDGRYIVGGCGEGTSDLLLCVNGHFVALEVKSLSGKARKTQLAFIQAIRQCGGTAEIVRSVDEAVAIVAGVIARSGNRLP